MTPEAKREAVGCLQTDYGLCERRAFAAMTMDRSTLRYQSMHPDHGKLRNQVKQIARERIRFGYRQIRVLLERGGIQ